MKNIIKTVFATAILTVGVATLSSCENNDSELVLDNKIEYVDPLTYDLKSLYVETSDLTEAEIEMLLFMKEEEKLARDVYYALYDLWGSRVFSNISGSEQRHIEAVVGLISYYDIGDSTINEPGVFTNNEVQALYQTLVKKGSTSLEEAMVVGATIEDLDINDLNNYLLDTDNENIILVFNHLIAGSENHLRAFNRQLVNLGATYIPQYISQELFNEIINTNNSQVPNKKYHHKGSNKNSGKKQYRRI